MTPTNTSTASHSKSNRNSTGILKTIIKSSIIQPSLVRQLLLLNNPNLRINQDGLVASGAFLHLFVTEAINRASIEAECEADSAAITVEEEEKRNNRVVIRGDHIAKIAADLLMDFS
jgi:hypothetical protein